MDQRINRNLWLRRMAKAFAEAGIFHVNIHHCPNCHKNFTGRTGPYSVRVFRNGILFCTGLCASEYNRKRKEIV